MTELKKYIPIIRFGHWVKNLFLLPGTIIAYLESDVGLLIVVALFAVGFLATSLVASANYVINELLDAEFDKHHPTKKFRSCVVNKVNPTSVYILYAILLVLGLGIGYLFVNTLFAVVLGILAICGVFYNVEPIRMKDRVYFDVLFESFNNVLRLALGWTLVTTSILPPMSLVLAFWMGGAFLMGAKRFAEYRFINDPKRAGLYRKSFLYYNESKLLCSCFFYALSFAFVFGIFLFKYRIEYMLTYPLFSMLFVSYLALSLKDNSSAQQPEKLYRESFLMLILLAIGISLAVLTVVDIPQLDLLLKMTAY
jgi:4-hydroxybenzoate polyprenyltransferase